MPHDPHSAHAASNPWRFWPALMVFAAIALFLLWEEHEAHLLGALPYLILAETALLAQSFTTHLQWRGPRIFILFSVSGVNTLSLIPRGRDGFVYTEVETSVNPDSAEPELLPSRSSRPLTATATHSAPST